MKIWLDDSRSPPEGWAWCKSYNAAIKALKTGKVREISLDYYLGQGRKTGLDLAKWILSQVKKRKLCKMVFAIHCASFNESLGREMQSVMDEADWFWTSNRRYRRCVRG